MVSAIPNPALDAFIARIAPEIVFAEVSVQKASEGFDLRHVADRDAPSLRQISANELRDIAQFTEQRQFRPLKSAPTLQHGWRFLARSSAELEFALQCLYPAAVADWFAVQQSNPPITSYRDFTARQTGMYRVTAMLTDDQAGHIARACCQKRFCLKQRLWTVEGLPPDGATEKSLIPCLEPCAILLEFARNVARVEQREPHMVPLTSDELATAISALERAIEAPPAELREADFAAPENPRRVQWLLEKLRSTLARKGEHENE